MSQSRIKVLIYTASLGGVQRHIQDIVSHLDHQRFELIGAFPKKMLNKAYLPQGAADYETIFTRAGLKSYLVETPYGLEPLALTKAIGQMVRVLRQVRPHVLHCHSSVAGAVGRLATLAWRPRRVLYTPHLMYCLRQKGLQRLIFSGIERALLPLTHKIIAVSDSEYQDIRTLFGPTAVLELVRNAVPLPGKVQSIKDLKLLPDWSAWEGKKIILSTARFDDQKDVPTLINAAQLLAKDRSDFVVLLAGDGQHYGEIKALIAQKKLTNIVHLLGWRQDVPQLLDICDVLVLSTRREGLPYALLEAMALGKPVVGSDVPGVRECIQSGQSGYLFPLGQASALAQILTQLLDNPAWARTLGQQGQLMVKERFAMETMISALENLYLGAPALAKINTRLWQSNAEA